MQTSGRLSASPRGGRGLYQGSPLRKGVQQHRPGVRASQEVRRGAHGCRRLATTNQARGHQCVQARRQRPGALARGARAVSASGTPRRSDERCELLIGRCVRVLRKAKAYHLLVTYADESQGHTGAIYRATNWLPAGKTKPEPRWLSKDGRQVARKATRTRTKAEMLALGYHVSGRYSKHRFIMSLGT